MSGRILDGSRDPCGGGGSVGYGRDQSAIKGFSVMVESRFIRILALRLPVSSLRNLASEFYSANPCLDGSDISIQRPEHNQRDARLYSKVNAQSHFPTPIFDLSPQHHSEIYPLCSIPQSRSHPSAVHSPPHRQHMIGCPLPIRSVFHRLYPSSVAFPTGRHASLLLSTYPPGVTSGPMRSVRRPLDR